jgi:transcriptional regulator with XRE-family HTH domain
VDREVTGDLGRSPCRLPARREITFVALRELRRGRLLSQRELAKLARVSQETIVDIETGKSRPHPSTLRKLAAALEVPPEALARHLED